MKTSVQNLKRMGFYYTLCFVLICSAQTHLIAQSPGPYNWSNLPIGGGGFVSGIITSKTQRGLIYARTDVGGAYRWDTINNRWISLIDWASDNQTGYLGVESLATDPSNPKNLYISVGISYFNNGNSAILRSSNQGASFSIIDVTSKFKVNGNGMGRNSGEKLVVDPNKGNILFCGTRSNGLFESADSGVTWNHVSGLNVTTTNNGNGICLVVFDPTSGSPGSATQTLVVGVSVRRTASNLYKSIDGGATFTPIVSSPATLMPQRAVFASDTSLYITYANGAGPYGVTGETMDTGQIYKYNLKTGVMTNISPAGFNKAFSGISVDPKNPKRIVASTISTYNTQGNAYGDQFFISTNGGSNWTNVVTRGYRLDPNGIAWMNNTQSIHWAGSIEFDPFNTKRVLVNSGNGLFATNNIDSIPTVWKFNVKGLEETVPTDLVSIPSGPILSSVGDYDGFRNKDVISYGAQNVPTMGTNSDIAYAALSPNIAVRVGSKMYFSTDTGKTWTQCTLNGSNGYLSISANGNTFLHSPNGSNTTYRSINKGTSWSIVNGLSTGNAITVADPVNTNKFYSYNNGSGVMMVSADGGVSFTASGSPGSGGSQHIRTVRGNEGHIWVALYGGGLTRSTNSGQSFTKINTLTACSAVGIGRKAPKAGYPTIYIWGTVNGVTGMFRSTDEGANWSRINDDAHEYGGPGNGQFVIGDENVFGRVYLSTAGRGIIYGSPLYDCAGVMNGTAYYDNCDSCVGGTTGHLACRNDCHGDKNGTAFLDSCKICAGGNTGITPILNKNACASEVKEVLDETNFTYSPNPFGETLYLHVKFPVEYNIFNLQGEELESGFCLDGCYIGAKLLPGIYLLKIADNKVIKTIKIIKQ